MFLGISEKNNIELTGTGRPTITKCKKMTIILDKELQLRKNKWMHFELAHDLNQHYGMNPIFIYQNLKYDPSF